MMVKKIKKTNNQHEPENAHRKRKLNRITNSQFGSFFPIENIYLVDCYEFSNNKLIV